MDSECGKIAKGYAADFIVLNPELDLIATYLDGVCRYHLRKEGVR
jgi:N-acetylglucosamine-6-phosphate deacetylase